MEDGSRAWVPDTHEGHLDNAPALAWLSSDCGIYQGNDQTEDFSFFFLSSNKFRNLVVGGWGITVKHNKIKRARSRIIRSCKDWKALVCTESFFELSNLI